MAPKLHAHRLLVFQLVDMLSFWDYCINVGVAQQICWSGNVDFSPTRARKWVLLSGLTKWRKLKTTMFTCKNMFKRFKRDKTEPCLPLNQDIKIGRLPIHISVPLILFIVLSCLVHIRWIASTGVLSTGLNGHVTRLKLLFIEAVLKNI